MTLVTATNRIMRMKDSPSKVGFQPSTIYELIAKKRFPKPFKLQPGGKAAGWLEADIDHWLMEQKLRSEAQ